MAIQIWDGTASPNPTWRTVKNISAFDGTNWVTSANAAIYDEAGSWVGFLDKVTLNGGTFPAVGSRLNNINAEVRWRLQINGLAVATRLQGVGGNETLGTPYTWCQNVDNRDLYEVEVQVTGAAVSGPQGANTWTSLSTAQSWTLFRDKNDVGTSTSTLAVNIRNKAATASVSANVIVASASIVLTALVDN
jgi:hypothetical protein